MKTEGPLFIVPSRGRPGNALELANEFARLRSRETSELIFIVDDDDPLAPEYQALELPSCAQVAIEPKIGDLSPILNRAARKFRTVFRFIGFMGDDHRPRTAGFDEQLVSAIEAMGGTGFAYPNDLLQGELIPTSCVMSSDIAEALGYISPPTLGHLCIDLFWLALGRGIDRITYLPDVILEHMHPANGKAPLDEGYKRVNSTAMKAHDGRAWQEYLAEDLETDIEKVRAIL